MDATNTATTMPNRGRKLLSITLPQAAYHLLMLREETFSVRTTAREQILIITPDVQRALDSMTKGDAIPTIIVPHTTCAVSRNENADTDVPEDLTKALRAL